MKVIMREEFPKSGENALNPEVSVEAGTEPPKKKVDSNVCYTFGEIRIVAPRFQNQFLRWKKLTIPQNTKSIKHLLSKPKLSFKLKQP